MLNTLLWEEKKYNYTMLSTSRINYCYFSSNFYINEYYKKNKIDYIILDYINAYKLNDILKTCDIDLSYINFTENDIELIKKNVKEVFSYYKGRNPKHNINHIIKVLLFAILLSKMKNLSNSNKEVLMESIKYHDVSRTNDSMDRFHGTNSATFYLKKYGSSVKKRVVAFIIEYHEMIDDIGLIKTLLKKYNLQYSEKLVFLANILKDADALDRLRFSNPYVTLNPNYLRIDSSKVILQFAYIVNSINQDLFLK